MDEINETDSGSDKSRSGGVDASADQSQVGGDVVGRDKVFHIHYELSPTEGSRNAPQRKSGLARQRTIFCKQEGALTVAQNVASEANERKNQELSRMRHAPSIWVDCWDMRT